MGFHPSGDSPSGGIGLAKSLKACDFDEVESAVGLANCGLQVQAEAAGDAPDRFLSSSSCSACSASASALAASALH